MYLLQEGHYHQIYQGRNIAMQVITGQKKRNKYIFANQFLMFLEYCIEVFPKPDGIFLNV